MTSINLDKCEVKITAKPDFENPKVVTRITLKATHPEHGAIANLSAYNIRRDYCRGQFLEVMDEYTDELHQFSIELFDKNGHLRPWLIDGSRRSGTGCWNRDINEGCLIYLMDMSVTDKVRRLIYLFLELELNICWFTVPSSRCRFVGIEKARRIRARTQDRHHHLLALSSRFCTG
jgi:hypothetical protein